MLLIIIMLLLLSTAKELKGHLPGRLLSTTTEISGQGCGTCILGRHAVKIVFLCIVQIGNSMI